MVSFGRDFCCLDNSLMIIALWQAARAISACNALTWLSLAGCTQVRLPAPHQLDCGKP